MKKTRTGKKNKNKTVNKAVKWLWKGFGLALGCMVLLFFGISMGWLGFMPSFTELENPKTNLATEIISEDGYVLGKYYVENRSTIQYHQLSENVVHALVATEDVRFYNHSGVDVRAILRALSGVLTFSNKGGGSTITQQLAKNLFPRQNDRLFIQTVFTKLKEWVVAVKLERNYSKEEIIAMYLNTVDFGNMSHGINSAAKTYFDKEPKDLTVDQSALLIGMLKAPSRFNPKRNPENAQKRRNVVLNQMCKYGFLEEEETETLKEKPIDMSRFKVQDHRVGTGTYFREFLRQQLARWAKENPKPDGSYWNIYTDGLKIYTTINYKMQLYAEEAVKEWVANALQGQFFNEWKGKKNAPFYNITESETETILVRAMKNSDRYKALKEQGWSEDRIRKHFDVPTKMWLFNGKDEVDTLLSPIDSIRHMKSFLNCGLLVMDPSTGKVRAYVGGVNFDYFQYDHVTMSRRQVGSTFKPFVYTAAMREGEFYPCSQVPNLPVTIDLPNGTSWTPKNSSKYK
jgi:penicillin-binding protein 1A